MLKKESVSPVVGQVWMQGGDTVQVTAENRSCGSFLSQKGFQVYLMQGMPHSPLTGVMYF